MKRAILFIFVLILLLPFTTTAASDNKGKTLAFALVEIDTGAAGGSVNYFVLRPLMEYDDESGIARGTMFDSLIFSLKTPPTKMEKAEGFITDLFKEGTCISAAETVAGEMKEDGFLNKDTKYPIYVSIPYLGTAADADADKEGFCKYFIDTLSAVFQDKGYKNVALSGVYFSSDYDKSPSLRSFCVEQAKAKGLECVVSTAIGRDIKNAVLIASGNSVKKQLDMQAEGKGYSLYLDGVPDDNDKKPYTDLVADYNTLRSAKIGKSNVLFSFRAYNDVYDCASSIENTLPNPVARETYELLREIINCPFDENSVPIKDNGKFGYYAGAAFALVGTAGIIYMIIAFYKKGKNNG